MKSKGGVSRRCAIKGVGALGASAIIGSGTGYALVASSGRSQVDSISRDIRRTIHEKVVQTSFVDTHEHLVEEKERLAGPSGTMGKTDDWSIVLSHYLDSDLIVAGMPQASYDKFFSDQVDPVEKWSLLAPYWPAVMNTGYGQAVRITMAHLYGIDELSAKTVAKVQSKYDETRQPGFYRRILCDLANIESCQVNCLTGKPFNQSDMATLLMQDLSILGMFAGPALEQYGKATGIEVSCLGDWHRVIDWWFQKYARYAVAVKSQNAYARDIDYEPVPAEKVEAIFRKRLDGGALTSQERKALEDHLFWYAVDKATEYNLPVKLHTGYYAGENGMPLARLINNPGSAAELCRVSPKTKFVFMHICYPYYEEMIALAKHYTNAYLDMCWAWIINPVAAKDFLKKYIVTAPANKILTFGGDYIPVEPVLGHATIARKGIALAFSELVEEGWLSLDDAVRLIDPIMRTNARNVFSLEEKTKLLKDVKWN